MNFIDNLFYRYIYNILGLFRFFAQLDAQRKGFVDKNLHNYSWKSVFTTNRIIQLFFLFFHGNQIHFISQRPHTHTPYEPQRAKAKALKKENPVKKPTKVNDSKPVFVFPAT